MNVILLYLGASLTLVWGTAHLFPIKNVVKGFGDISPDNKRIITMEWIVEGASLIFLGILTATMTYVDFSAWLSKLVFLLVVAFLVVLSLISFMTGFKVSFLPYKLCPFIFLASAGLIFIGGVFNQAEPEASNMLEKYKTEIVEAERAFADMAAEKGVKEAFVHFVADSGVMNRNNTIVKGKEALAAYFDKQTLTDVKLEWEPDFVDVSSSGDLAYTYGKFTFSAKGPDGKEMEAKGLFHTVWKRQEDGSWRFVYD